MGLISLLEMRNEVESSMGTRTAVTPARRTTWINLAYNDIASGIDFEELDGELAIPTVAAQNNYTGPVNPLIVQMLRDEDNDNLLTWVPKSEYFRLDRSVTAAAPQRWTRRGVEILIWPNPDIIYNLLALYKITPTALTADGDFTILPPYIDNGIIFLATAYGLLAVNEDQRGIVWANRAVNYLSSRLTNQDFSFLLGGLGQTQPTAGSAVEGSASGT